jgi:hypothetical protein
VRFLCEGLCIGLVSTRVLDHFSLSGSMLDSVLCLLFSCFAEQFYFGLLFSYTFGCIALANLELGVAY